jgi:MYXO-CTERM domain-containing protein
LPREHGSYRESDKSTFLLRYNGQPLVGATLWMETEFGTRTAFTSNGDGEVTVLIPRDFKPTQRGHAEGAHVGRQRGGFVLVAEHEADGKRYLTAFNHSCAPDPDRGRSLAWGAAFGLLGMVAAAPLLRRRVSKEGAGRRHA